VAYVFEDLLEAIKGKDIVLETNSPNEDIVIEFIQFNKPENEVWAYPTKFQI